MKDCVWCVWDFVICHHRKGWILGSWTIYETCNGKWFLNSLPRKNAVYSHAAIWSSGTCFHFVTEGFEFKSHDESLIELIQVYARKMIEWGCQMTTYCRKILKISYFLPPIETWNLQFSRNFWKLAISHSQNSSLAELSKFIQVIIHKKLLPATNWSRRRDSCRARSTERQRRHFPSSEIPLVSLT